MANNVEECDEKIQKSEDEMEEMDTSDVNKEESNDSDESSSEEEDKKEQEHEQKVIEYEKRIKKNIYDYDAHVGLVNIRNEMADLFGLRSAYERFSKLFPLTPQLWLSWISIETKIASSQKENSFIFDLFECGIKDYLSVKLWLEYVQFAMGVKHINFTRNLFERALNAAGTHVSEGSLLWDAYREFELAHLSLISDTESEEWKEQVQRILKLYKRQLSVPLVDMDHTYVELRVWCEKLPSQEIVDKKEFERIYNKSAEHLKKLEPFENRLLNATEESEKSVIYNEYFEVEKSNPVRLNNLFERAVGDVPLNRDIWYRYCEHAINLGGDGIALDICNRSIRNCSWDAELWLLYMRALERFSKEHDKVMECFENSLSACNTDAASQLSLWVGYLEHCRRLVDEHILKNGETETMEVDKNSTIFNFEYLRKVFSKAHDSLTENWGPIGDPNCVVLRFWARIEASFIKDIEAARKLWSDIIHQGHSSNVSLWFEIIDLEKRFGDSKHIRKTYQRALNSLKEQPHSIIESWINFERDEGSLDTLMSCLEKSNSVIKRWEESSHSYYPNMTTYDKEKSKQSREHVSRSLKQMKPPDRKRKSDTNIEISSPDKRSRHFEKELPAISELKVEDENSTKQKHEDRQTRRTTAPVEMDPEVESRSVFVSNLDYGVDEETLKEWLGQVKELRLVKDFKGRSKGYSYVEFNTVEEAQAALKRDRERLCDRPVFISKCKSEKTKRDHGFKYATAREQHKLFVKGLPLNITQKEIEDVFSPHGNLKQVRMVCYRNGHFKGLAYIEYETPAEAAKALVKTDNTEVGGHTISVAISSPPERKESETSAASGGDKQKLPLVRKSRLQIPFVPSVLQKSSTSETTAAKPKSNADFRQMLLGKK